LRCFAGRAWFDQLIENALFLLIYGFPPGIDESSELKRLTGEVLSGIVALPSGKRRFTVHPNLPGGPYPISGMSYTAAAAMQLVLLEGPDFPMPGPTFLSRNGPTSSPFLGGEARVFLLAEETLVDIDTALTPESALRCLVRPAGGPLRLLPRHLRLLLLDRSGRRSQLHHRRPLSEKAVRLYPI